MFLALAPLAPVAGVAITFGPGADPSFELTVASPISTVRLLLLRAAAVLATTLVLAAAWPRSCCRASAGRWWPGSCRRWR